MAGFAGSSLARQRGALKSSAFFVGAVGSCANNKKRKQRLALFDLAHDEIARLHGPVGLAISSCMPPEIAVAIMAQLTQIRNNYAPEAVPAQQALAVRDHIT